MSEPRNNVFLPDLCTTRAVLVVVVASEAEPELAPEPEPAVVVVPAQVVDY